LYIYIAVYSPELTEALSRYDITGLADLEEKLISSFANSNRCWREGTLKSSFNYLLLDPRVTKNLPNRMYSNIYIQIILHDVNKPNKITVLLVKHGTYKDDHNISHYTCNTFVDIFILQTI
jgi:hypothetical protein